MACTAAEVEKAGGPELTLAVVNVGSVDAALFQRVVKHLEKYLKLPCRVVPPCAPAEGHSLEEQAKALAPLVKDHDLCLVALLHPDWETEKQIGVFPSHQVALVNTVSLRPDPFVQEGYGRRVEKEAMRCVGILAGMPPTPNPHSALWVHSSDEQLDVKGRAFDPPGQARFEEILQKRRQALVP